MGDIVDFPTPKKSEQLPTSTGTRNSRPELKGPSREELFSQGGEALEQLGAWKSRGIPDKPATDRISMARNMDAILNELRIKPRDLPWRSLYNGDREAFNRDLSRMRLPAHAAPGRRLMAHTSRWIDLLKMISAVCEARGENLTLNGLAERLTRGTRFHPVKRAQSLEEKQLYKLKLWANDVDEKTGLLRTFKHLSALRAEHFRLHLRDYGDDKVDTHIMDAIHLRPSTFFEEIPEDVIPLFGRELGSYSQDDWDCFYQRIPAECVHQFECYQRDIKNWRANFEPGTALFADDGDEYLPLDRWIWSDFEYLPRAYLGRLDWERLRLLEYYNEQDFPTGTQDPLSTGSQDECIACGYLVLYPNPELNRLLPYLLHLDEEGSFFIPLTESVLLDVSLYDYFPPDKSGEQCVSKPLLARVEEEEISILTAWINTARDLKNHPYFGWESNRSDQIDEELARMTAPRRTEPNHGQGE